MDERARAAAEFVLTLEGKRGPKIAEMISAFVEGAIAQAVKERDERITLLTKQLDADDLSLYTAYQQQAEEIARLREAIQGWLDQPHAVGDEQIRKGPHPAPSGAHGGR